MASSAALAEELMRSDIRGSYYRLIGGVAVGWARLAAAINSARVHEHLFCADSVHGLTAFQTLSDCDGLCGRPRADCSPEPVVDYRRFLLLHYTSMPIAALHIDAYCCTTHRFIVTRAQESPPTVLDHNVRHQRLPHPANRHKSLLSQPQQPAQTATIQPSF